MSEQVNYGETGIDARLINHADDTALPVGVHDFADAIGRCMLVDKTMFIADVLDCDAFVVVCCRPEGFGKSMNLSMLKAFLECPVIGRADPGMFVGTQIWDAEEGLYRDEYACYPVIMLDFSFAAKRGADAAVACAIPSPMSVLVCCRCWQRRTYRVVRCVMSSVLHAAWRAPMRPMPCLVC